jgi:hypothetical protein
LIIAKRRYDPSRTGLAGKSLDHRDKIVILCLTRNSAKVTGEEKSLAKMGLFK